MRRRDSFGFTLIGLLAVIAIIAILAAILFPAFAQAREKPLQASRLGSMGQLGASGLTHIPLSQFAGLQSQVEAPKTWDDFLRPYVENLMFSVCPSPAATINCPPAPGPLVAGKWKPFGSSGTMYLPFSRKDDIDAPGMAPRQALSLIPVWSRSSDPARCLRLAIADRGDLLGYRIVRVTLYPHVADACDSTWHNPGCGGNPTTWARVCTLQNGKCSCQHT